MFARREQQGVDAEDSGFQDVFMVTLPWWQRSWYVALDRHRSINLSGINGSGPEAPVYRSLSSPGGSVHANVNVKLIIRR